MQSEINGQYYIGHTGDLEARLSEHNTGRVRSTKFKKPWDIVYFEEYASKLEANRRELEIKKKKSRKYIDFLIRNKRE